MEPEVHIIEKFFHETLKCFTMTNIRCRGGKEIDLLAVNPVTGEKYHVESRIGTSPSFRIREKDTHTSDGRPYKIGLDYFRDEKFDHPFVTEKINELFGDSTYYKVLVVWDVYRLSLITKAQKDYGIDIWFMDDLIETLMKHPSAKGSRDDVLRILEMLYVLERDRAKAKGRSKPPVWELKLDEENPSIAKPDLEKARLPPHMKRQLRKAWKKVGLRY